jgi:hypothetical protein
MTNAERPKYEFSDKDKRTQSGVHRDTGHVLRRRLVALLRVKVTFPAKVAKRDFERMECAFGGGRKRQEDLQLARFRSC